jgi:membrane metallo-endopeptidase-like protein 1
MQLALPSRDYYLKADSEGDLRAYHRYMTEVAKLLGANASQAAEELQEVIRFERELASVSTGRHSSSTVIKLLRCNRPLSFFTVVIICIHSV